MKDSKEYRDPPQEGLPQPAPQQNVEEAEISLKEYYQNSVSSLEAKIAYVDTKVAGVIGDPDISPADAKRVARKLGRGQKFLLLVKAKVAYLEATEDVEERGGPDHIQEDPIVVAARELEGPDGALDGL
ncbi:hypothetical protein PVAP13_5NG075504 [Panicum virgatum]|uniref:Uncharacterized protein n=2 Tax=Panicum virgatum TaxID=38727 RepID=A0A8T0RJN8_PANVG|nr:hypothetical protein PVAP13_5NG075504 [Panicum virgatum]